MHSNSMSPTRLGCSICTIIICLVSFSGFAQKIGIRVYQNTDVFSKSITTNGITTEDWKVKFNRLSLALDINAKHDITHEIEVFIPEVKRRIEKIGFPHEYHIKTASYLDIRESSFAMRYEINKKILKSNGPISARIGLAINPYFLQIQSNPTEENTYSSSAKNYGASFNIVPAVTYSLSKKVQLTLNLPLRVYDIEYEVKAIHNPAIPVRQQETTQYNSAFFEKVFTMRLGVTYTFGQ